MDEISQGVRILIERCETNPDEMMEEYGKWSQLRNAVFDYMENRGNPDRHAWLRGLREDEINLLYEAFGANYRRVFDEYVMKNVLGDEEEGTLRFKATERYVHGWNDPRMLAQNTIQPGSWQNVAVQSSGTSIATSLKNALGIK